MKFYKAKKTRFLAEINLTPLIDMVFLLLIFLLISTTFKKREHAFNIDLPTASQQEITVTGDKNLIFITDNKEIFLYLVSWKSDEKPKKVSIDELKNELKKIAEESKEIPISIRAEKDTPFQSLMDIINVCYEVGLLSIELPYEYREE